MAVTKYRERTITSAPLELRSADIHDEHHGRRLFGVVAPFDSPEIINDGYGKFRERIQRGAFKRTLRDQAPERIPMLFGHDTRSVPVGKYEALAEGPEGLEVDGYIFRSREDVREAAEAGVLQASIGFQVLDEVWMLDGERLHGDAIWRNLRNPDVLVDRILTSVRLREISLVPIPAYSKTHVGVRDTTTTISVAEARSKLLRLSLRTRTK
ncbi:HK97 family phage prohead protease [Nocardia flavorosea]|uniref:Prohead serine protease domain-containing protein n=1 Tax=Nocardia flavorosea TaxID=53429 RepID=A0A846YID9_9NOCA|nr:HK97 family phage prohead protease [Nocardia flavorosea]NKY57404.1 hypothetical protein [Nocardia flavorosea]